MSRTRRRYEIAAAIPVVAMFTAFYVSDIVERPRESIDQYFGLGVALGIPTALWLAASSLLVRHWWRGAGTRLSTLDAPGRLLELAVGMLPEHRRAWGGAMAAELAEVHGRSTRWRFALSCAGAALRMPRSSSGPPVALAAGIVVAAGAAAGLLVGMVLPGLALFSTSFVAVLGALVVLTIARSRRLQLPVPGPTALVVVGVALSIAVTATFIHRHPDTLTPNAAVYLAAMLAGCVWIAVTTPRSTTGKRLGPRVGAGAALLYMLGLLGLTLWSRVDSHPDVVAFLFNWIAGAPGVLFFAALVAGTVGKSFRSGLQAGVWAAITLGPLAYTYGLSEQMRQYAIDGTFFDGEIADSAGQLMSQALGVTWIILPLLAWPLAVLGARLGAPNATSPAGVAPDTALTPGLERRSG